MDSNGPHENVGQTFRNIQQEPTNPEIYISSVQSVLASSRIGHLVTLSYLNRFNLSDFPNSKITESAEENLNHILQYI